MDIPRVIQVEDKGVQEGTKPQNEPTPLKSNTPEKPPYKNLLNYQIKISAR